MREFDYVVVGGGAAGDAATRGIREQDTNGSIAMISAEDSPPYMKGPMVKDLMLQEFDSIWFQTKARDVELFSSRLVTDIIPHEHLVTDAIGMGYKYEKLILALGSKPREIPGDPEIILQYWTLEDYQTLMKLTQSVHDFLIIGGGIIAQELVAQLVSLNLHVTSVFQEKNPCQDMFPRTIAKQLMEDMVYHGVNVIPMDKVTDVRKHGDRVITEFLGSQDLTTGAVISIAGATPNLELASNAGIAVKEGIIVNSHMETSQPDILAAGSNVIIEDETYMGASNRFFCQDHAISTGMIAGINATGERARYDHFPRYSGFFFDKPFHVIGHIDAKLDYVIDWGDEEEKAIVYYIQCGKIEGILFWNTPPRFDQADELIRQNGIFSSQNVLGRIRFKD